MNSTGNGSVRTITAGGLRVWRVLAWLWMVFILVECWTPRPPVDASNSDTAAHAAGFMVLGLLLGLASRERDRRGRWWACLFGVSWAGLSEGGQVFVRGRSASLVDWLADVGGLGAGLVLAWLVVGLYKKYLMLTEL